MDVLWALIGVTLLFGLLELVTTNLVFASLAAGTATVAAVNAVDGPLAIQLGLGVTVTAICLFAIRPSVLHKMQNGPELRSGTQALVGKTGYVLDVGRRSIVNVDGQQWSAVTHNNEPLTVGAPIWVVEVHGATLIVAPDGDRETLPPAV